jgi:hypothetical protein
VEKRTIPKNIISKLAVIRRERHPDERLDWVRFLLEKQGANVNHVYNREASYSYGSPTPTYDNRYENKTPL